MSSSYNTPWIKHKLVVSIYWNTETSLAMSTLVVWCRVVRSRDVRSRDFSAPVLQTAITFHHFFTVSLWAQNLPREKILSSTLFRFCVSNWSHGSITVYWIYLLISFYVLVLFLSVLVIPMYGRLSWHQKVDHTALWSTSGRTIIYSIDLLIDVG